MDKSSKPVAVKSEAAAKADVTIKADKTAGKPAPAVKAEVKPAPAVRSPTRAAAANGKGEGVKMEAKRSGRPTKPAVVEKEIESEDDSDSDESSDDDVPLKERQASKPSPASKAMPSAPLVKKSRSSNASGSVNGGEDKCEGSQSRASLPLRAGRLCACGRLAFTATSTNGRVRARNRGTSTARQAL
eukprot:6189122-Pleurochrysis_carterae.AAC.3